MDYKGAKSSIKKPSIPTLIHQIKTGKVTEDTKINTLYILEVFGYYLLTLLHDKGTIDLFDPKYKCLLITMLNECHLEYNKSPTLLRYDELKNYISSLGDVPEYARIKILQKVQEQEIIKKIDRTWHLLRDLHDITVEEHDIMKAHKRYYDKFII